MKTIIHRGALLATRHGRPFLACAVLALLAASAPAQFTDPYNGVGRSVRSSPLPIVVMCYEPNTAYSYKRYAMFGRAGNTLLNIFKDRDSTWFGRYEVSFVPGLTPADDPVSFRNPDGSIASIFVLGSDGVVYQTTTARYDEPGTWRAWSSLPSNVRMASSCAAVNTPGGTGVSVLAVGRDGRLYNAFFSRGSGGGWINWSPVPGSPSLVGRPTAVNSTNGQELHVLATDSSGVVRHVHYTRGTGGGWSSWSALPGVPGGFHASPSCYVLGTLLSVFATGTDGQVRQAVRGGGGWGSWSSLGGASVGSFVAGPSAVNSPDESTLDIVALDSAGHVERKTYTRGTGGGWSGWSVIDVGDPLSSGVTLANWHTRTATVNQIRGRFFNQLNSVKHWFDENSQGAFPVREGFISNWHVLPDDPTTSVDESSYEYFHGPDEAGKVKWMIEQFELLNPGFRFADYDTQQPYGTITRDELMIYWLYPGRSGRTRGVPQCISVPSISGCGISLDLGVPRTAAHVGAATCCEELCHALFGLDDLYETSQLPNYVGPGQLSLISNNAAFPHLHPWGKMKLGWVRPTIVTQDGWQLLRPVEQYPDLLVVHDPAKGPDDYFLVENRWPDASIEHALPDRGIGVWRISEHYEANPPPPDWGRHTIKLLRAGGEQRNSNGQTDDTIAFWDANDPRTAYHLTPTSRPAAARWEDGTSSNIAIYHFPGSAAVARVFVDVPPLRSAPPPPFRFASYDYIDQQPPYSNPSPSWLVARNLPVIGARLDVEVPRSFVQGTNLITYFLVTGFVNPNQAPPVLGGYQYASLDVLDPVPFGSPGQTTVRSLFIPTDPGLSGFPLFQQVLRADLVQGFPIGVSRGGALTLGF